MIRQLVLGLDPNPLVVMLGDPAFSSLACLPDDIAILFMCMPIYIPIIMGPGMDPVWFGILLFCKICKMAYITPPYGTFLHEAVAPKNVTSQGYLSRRVALHRHSGLPRLFCFVFFPE